MGGLSGGQLPRPVSVSCCYRSAASGRVWAHFSRSCLTWLWGAGRVLPPRPAGQHSLSANSAGLPPQNTKAKEGGFFISCLATQGGKTIRDVETAPWGGGVHHVVSPQSPRTLPPGLRRRERGTGKAGRVEQREPRLGPADHSPGRRSRWAFAQEAPPARLLGALLCGGAWGSGLAALLCTHCTPGRGQP